MPSQRSSIAAKAEVPLSDKSSFWKSNSGPVFALAPMEDVTDTVFREVILGISDPRLLNILYTEFTNVDGMNHPVGRSKVGQRLIVSETEKQLLAETGVKLVAQVWGSDPEIFSRVVKEISESRVFDGIDVNMGCPDKNVVKSGSCSALIGKPELAKEILLATIEATSLPVSVKTRTGLREHITESWIGQLLEVNPAAIILHGRTQKQMSDGEADWNQIGLAANLRNQAKSQTAIIGNGDIFTYEKGREFSKKFGLDGIMVGRGIFHNPWFFQSEQQAKTRQQKIELMISHINLFRHQWEGKKSLYTIKRYLKIYANGFEGAVRFRGKLMQCKSYDDLLSLAKTLMI